MPLQCREAPAGELAQDRGVGEHTWLPFRGLVVWVRLENSAGNQVWSKYGKQHWCVWQGILEENLSAGTKKGTKLVPSRVEKIDLRLFANWQCP